MGCGGSKATSAARTDPESVIQNFVCFDPRTNFSFSILQSKRVQLVREHEEYVGLPGGARGGTAGHGSGGGNDDDDGGDDEDDEG